MKGGICASILGDTSIAISKTVRSLGVTLDETLSFNSQVDNVCKAAHFHIRALRHIRRCIDDETARTTTVACSMVGARLDYCNSILHGTSAGNLGRIQRVINTLARVVSSARIPGSVITSGQFWLICIEHAELLQLPRWCCSVPG